MKVYKYPLKSDWAELCQRPQIKSSILRETVEKIMLTVKEQGDEALKLYSQQFDQYTLDQVLVSEEEILEATSTIDNTLKEAIKIASKNIEKFHSSQRQKPKVVETCPGVKCWQQNIGIENVGLYIPGGSAPLFSTVLMLGIPAIIAGCKKVILCTPPNADGTIDPAILYTANLIGIQEIYKIGGAQAIAAMTYGTQSVPKVNKIFGPGNQYVTMAKAIAQMEGTAIDMQAGPSEVLVIAGEGAKASYIAADLLSQAEHGPDSQVILLANKMSIIDEVMNEIQNQLKLLPRKDIAAEALENSSAILLNDMNESISFSNEYAPEHLIIADTNAKNYIHQITNAGSVFLGHMSCESAGDYASGTNHTLPTYGYAKNHSGVNLDSFLKKITFQEITPIGLKNIGTAIEIMANTEGLEGHKNAVSIRLKDIENGN